MAACGWYNELSNSCEHPDNIKHVCPYIWMVECSRAEKPKEGASS